MKIEETNVNSDIKKATAQCILTMAGKHIGDYGISDGTNAIQHVSNKSFLLYILNYKHSD